MTVRFFLILFTLSPFLPASSPTFQPTIGNQQSAAVRVAVLDFGETRTGESAAERVSEALAAAAEGARLRLTLLDRGMARAAARGALYRGSLNMTLREARDLGSAVGCDFFVTGDAQTLRRSSSARPVYFESYASIFIVSARTGRLVTWERPAPEGATSEEAESALLAELNKSAGRRYLSAIAEAHEREERERLARPNAGVADAFIDLSAEEAEVRHKDVREPAPYRRLRPAYTDAAARAEAEATVDASVEIGEDGEVARVEIVRWAGFGLDDAVISTVRQLHFRPATRDGTPVPVRVLLRYNFRRPPPEKQ